MISFFATHSGFKAFRNYRPRELNNGMLAGAGAPGVVALALVSMVLVPLGLPVNAAVIMLLAVNFIIDPALTILNFYLTCVAVVVFGREGCRYPKAVFSGKTAAVSLA